MYRSLFLTGLLLLPLGCGSQPTGNSNTSTDKPDVDPWPAAVNTLRRETDPSTCRRVVGQLGNELSLNRSAAQPAALPPEAEATLKTLLNLRDEDLALVRTANYSPLDGTYLGDCYYLRDAAKSLEPPSSTPLNTAEEAFYWVCRQVELRPWLIKPGNGMVSPTLPPTAVLRRGSGNGLERAYAFLGVLQQLGLDGCLIGGPNAGTQSGTPLIPLTSTEVPNGPFWAVGVRIGADIFLFDPWHAVPVAGPGGKGIATLAQVNADPSLAKSTGVSPEVAKESRPFLVVPLSAIAPRMKLLEEKLKEDAPVKLALDPIELQKRFRVETKRDDVNFWTPENDPFSYLLGLTVFVPADEGGRDTRPEGQRFFDYYRQDMLPGSSLFKLPRSLTSPEARSRLIPLLAGPYAAAFLMPPTPRESLQRGNFSKATEELVKTRTQFAAGKERLRTDKNREAEAEKWVAKAVGLYDQLSRSRLDEKTNPLAVSKAQEALDEFWRTNDPGLAALIDDAGSDAGLAESTYLLALCKHEIAERMESRYLATLAGLNSATEKTKANAERAREQALDRARDAWAEARDWWQRYEPYAIEQERSYPGRTAHARELGAQTATALHRLGR